jgi:hypothetical protein
MVRAVKSDFEFLLRVVRKKDILSLQDPPMPTFNQGDEIIVRTAPPLREVRFAG